VKYANDVRMQSDLPYATDGVTLNPQRRVAADRHGGGPVLNYYDGHSALRRAQQIVVNDWNDTR
jgi:hypothetical protein